MLDESLVLFITNVFVIGLCGWLFLIMPNLTRKSLLFGVSIPLEQANSPEATALKKAYTRTCLLGLAVILAASLAQFALWPEHTLLALMVFPLLFIPIYFAAFVPNWKKALRLKQERGWQVPSLSFAETGLSHTRGSLSALPWAWYIVSVVVAAAAIGAAVARFPALPDEIAGHLNYRMQPSYMVEKTWLSVLMMPLINAGTLVLLIAAAISIEMAKLQIDPSRPRLSFAQHRAYRWRMGHALGLLTFATVSMVGVLGLAFVYPDSSLWGPHVFCISMIAFCVPSAILLAVQVKTGQGGCKVVLDVDEGDAHAHEPHTAKTGADIWGDDKHWLLGIFYFNPDDPTYIVEDRFGVNIGFNYARLPVQIVSMLTLLGVIAAYVWTVALLISR